MNEKIELDITNINILTDNLDKIKGFPKIIKVPENFADLLTLCKNTKGCCVLRAGDRQYIEVPTILTGYSFTFHENGNIFFYEDVCVKEKATSQQMWKIIMGLLGE